MVDKSVFSQELAYLKNVQQILNNEKNVSKGLYTDYVELAKNYETLLKTSQKIFRISDIQGKALKKKEEEIKEVSEERMKLVSEISHEIGSPMIAIQRYLKAILEGMINYDQESIEMTYKNVEIVNQLIQDLFELSKLEETTIRFDFKKISLEQFISLFEKYRLPCKNKNIYFSMQSSVEINQLNEHFLKVDPYRIDQVASNIIGNALKYTKKGDNIELRFSPTTINKQAFLQAEITDTGTGIDPSHLPHLFNRFYKGKPPLDPEATSSGLGLSIAKEIILKHGGKIDVKSEVNKGSTFYFTLPFLSV